MQCICQQGRLFRAHLYHTITTDDLTRSHLTVWLRLALLLLLVGGLSFGHSAPVRAAPLRCAAGQPATPLTPVDAWLALASGDQQWYAFRDEGDDTPIAVRMTVVPADGASFIILTPPQAKRWVQGETDTAVGRGTPLAAVNDDLYWTGSFVQSGTYYVLVKSNNRGLSNYKLTINGKRVSYPLLSFTPPNFLPPATDSHCPGAEPAVGAPAISPTMRPVATTPGNAPQLGTTEVITSSPENPLPPIGQSLKIVGDERHWYAFRDEGDESSIRISADATPDNCLAFQLWTTEQLRLWRLNETFRPVGEGTPNTLLKADLFWSGSFVKSGVYYVVVERNQAVSGVCTYALTVTGDDVSLVNPTPAP